MSSVFRWLTSAAVVVVGVALLVVGGMWWAHLVATRERADAPPAAPEPETVEVWVAARDLPAGALLFEDRLPELAVKKSVPKHSLPPTTIADEKDLLGEYLTRAVKKDEPFTPESVTKNRKVPAADERPPAPVPGPAGVVPEGRTKD